MTTLDELTDDVISAYTSEQTFARGRALYQAGAVLGRELFDNVELDAEVREGKRSYYLDVHFEGNGLIADCDCRESKRAACAHIVAVLLAWVHEPDSFERENDLDVDDVDDFDLDEVVDLEILPPASMPPATAGAPPLDAEREVAQMLNGLNLTQLRDLAKRNGLSTSGNAREAFVKPLAKILSQPEAVIRAWPTLSRPAQKLLGALPLMRSNNLVFPQQAKQAFQMIDGKAAASFDALLRELNNAGLVFAFQQQLISVPSQLGLVLPPDAEFGPQPDDVARLKPQTAAPAPLDFVSLTMRLALVIKANPDRFTARQWPVSHPIEQQYFGLAGWPHYPAELEALKYEKLANNQVYGKSFGVPPAPSPEIDEARDELARAVGATPDRLDFALRLLIAIGLVKAVPQQPLSIIERAFTDWLTRPLLDRANLLFTAYANLNAWTELDRLSELHHPAPHLRHLGGGYAQTYSSILTLMSTARGYLLLMLRRVPPDRWIDLEAFVARARAFHYNPSVWPLTYGAYLDLNGRQPNTANAQDWQATYGPFLETLLTGPLWWQGAVELATRLDRVAAFRLTDFGAYLLGQNPVYAPPHKAEARTQSAAAFLPNDELILNVEIASTQLLSLLTQIGEARSDPAGQLIYRLSPAGVSRLFEAGWDEAKLIGAVQKSIGQPLPQSWRDSIAQWWANFGTLHLYADVAVIELADDYALTELLAGTSLAKHLLYRFSPRLIAVRAEGVAELQNDLIRKGYTPKVMSNDQ